MNEAETPEVIEPGQLLTAQEARKRARLGLKAWKELRAAGLAVSYHGRQAYVASDDLIAAILRKPEVKLSPLGPCLRRRSDPPTPASANGGRSRD
jgi:hypothetical protein